MGKLLREPLLHFALMGVVLFAVYGWVNGDASSAPREIVVSQGQLDSLQAKFERVWQRPPSADELRGLVDQWVREEILYREGRARGLDLDDPVVRRLVAQKMEFIAEGVTPEVPDDTTLEAWLAANQDKYAIEPRYTLRQVYLNPAQRGARLEADIDAARAALAGGRMVDGDSTMLPAVLDSAPGREVARVFGAEFAASLKGLPTGEWAGPVRSGFGLHLVKVEHRVDGRAATLPEVRDTVVRDLLRDRATQAKESFYRKLRAGYTIRTEAGEKKPKPAG
ncbi:peptidyl-prolyl cis-trans isomerase [uncultured Reyranella sp.]|uniref:Parvulin-like PPIase n=1 Tax=Reyranella aquatilis TaxID=2035356 RepID=A0ABS8L250_9HYPH|nr:peptidyl-prolyl cis-trans isomerase [uncultured Reyranella sp.]MCC8431851.1 peptidyl-prolyl cis-trans isomerase [Reyranella aquatilis]